MHPRLSRHVLPPFLIFFPIFYFQTWIFIASVGFWHVWSIMYFVFFYFFLSFFFFQFASTEIGFDALVRDFSLLNIYISQLYLTSVFVSNNNLFIYSKRIINKLFQNWNALITCHKKTGLFLNYYFELIIKALKKPPIYYSVYRTCQYFTSPT